MLRTFYLFSAGCIRRGLDTIRIQNYLQSNGLILTSSIRGADLIVVSTCGVVQLNETASLNAIAEAAKRRSPSSTIVVSGCLPKINPDEINKLGDFVFIPTGEFEKFDELIAATVPFRDIKPPDSIADNTDITNYLVARSFCRQSPLYKKLFYKFSMNSNFLTASTRVNKAFGRMKSLLTGTPAKKIVPYYNIEIARGCMSHCTFCATKLAIGQVRSWPSEQIVGELERGLAKGYRFFQLISEDTGCYGLDTGTSLPSLLEQMFSVEGDYQLIIIDHHPRWLVEHADELVPLLVRHQDKVKELFVPLQSGSDRMLKRMVRDHTAAQIRPILGELTDRAPAISLRTGFLVGFPGETDEDFEATKQFIRDIDFAEVTINRYEDRPNTPSSRMDAKVDQEVIEERVKYLVDNLGCLLLS